MQMPAAVKHTKVTTTKTRSGKTITRKGPKARLQERAKKRKKK